MLDRIDEATAMERRLNAVSRNAARTHRMTGI
jgi:hypothetical protein